MPARDAHTSGRWTIALPDEEVRPVGPDSCLRNAIDKLGPFKHKLQDDANRLGPRIGLNGRIALSEELAFERVWILATSYNRQRRLEQNAPRSKGVVERLTKVEALAGELARHLESLDDITRHRLQTAGTGITSFSEICEFQLIKDADAAGLPAPSGWNKSEEQPRWVQGLKALSQYANFSRTTFLHSKGIDDPDRPDKGGNTNLYRELYGSAQWGLVSSGWYDYELFKPGEATGTEGGPFHLFLLDVFEFATGLDPEEHSKLTYWLKRVSKVNRQYEAITARQSALTSELIKIRHSRCQSAETSKRAEEIAREMVVLERAHLELWPSLWPYSYGQAGAK